VQHDRGWKKYYEISISGWAESMTSPSPKWENGGDGGVTLESLGGGKIAPAYIAVVMRAATRPERSPMRGSSFLYSGDSTDRSAVVHGRCPVRAACRSSVSGPSVDTDRYYVIMVDPLCTVGRQQAVRWAR